MHESLKIFDEAVTEAGMEMSVAKTKVMQTGKGAGKVDISLNMGAERNSEGGERVQVPWQPDHQ